MMYFAHEVLLTVTLNWSGHVAPAVVAVNSEVEVGPNIAKVSKSIRR